MLDGVESTFKSAEREVFRGSPYVADLVDFRGTTRSTDHIPSSDYYDPAELLEHAKQSQILKWIKRAGMGTGASMGAGVAAMIASNIPEIPSLPHLPGINIDPQTQLNLFIYGKSVFWGGVLGHWGSGKFIGERIALAWTKARIDKLSWHPETIFRLFGRINIKT